LNLFKGPAFIRRDLKLVRKLLASFQPDFIISDHRYGFRSNKVTSIFCTHQVQLHEETPFFVQSMHRNWVNQFSGVWIFDNEQEPLAGELSRGNEKSNYIGHYSRFQTEINAIAVIPGKIVAIISGPEPYNKQLLDLITKLSTRFATKITIVCPELMVTVNDSMIDYIHDWRDADSAILAAEWVISRNGYSTLMDIKQLQKKALLLATPGQLEQIYFAEVSNLFQQGVYQVVDETAFEKQWELLFNRHAS
jgi:translation initiation factor 1 (eIF-1/SUI1)